MSMSVSPDESEAMDNDSQKRRIDSTFVIRFGVSAVLIVSLIVAATSYAAYRKASESRPEGSEAERIAEHISAFMELPDGEVPTLAIVTDREKLADQEFFDLAENGDQVLIYERAKKALLFRPSTGRVMNVAPIRDLNIAESDEAPEFAIEDPVVEGAVSEKLSESTSKEERGKMFSNPARVALLNGSQTLGVTHPVEDSLEEQFGDDIEVVMKEAAENGEYSGTVVYDLAGIWGDESREIAQVLEGSIGEISPEAEAVPDDVDILVLIGNVSDE